MLEAMAHWNLDAFTHYYSAGEVMGPYSRPRVSQSYVMECKDGKWIALHMSSPEKFWQGLANAIERPDMFQDPRFATREARIEHQEDIIEVLAGIFATRTAHRVVQPAAGARTCRMRRCTTPARRCRTRRRSTCSCWSARSTPTMGEFRTVRPPVSFDGERSLSVRPPPTLGEHNGEVDAMLREAGRGV